MTDSPDESPSLTHLPQNKEAAKEEARGKLSTEVKERPLP